MKTKVQLEIDLNKITEELLIEDQAGYWSVTARAKDEIKKAAIDKIVKEVFKIWKIDDLEQWAIKKSYSPEKYLTQTAQNYLYQEVGKYAEGYLKDWMEKSFNSFINKKLEELLEERITPIFNNLIKKLLVFNTQSLEEEQRAMEDSYQQVEK